MQNGNHIETYKDTFPQLELIQPQAQNAFDLLVKSVEQGAQLPPDQCIPRGGVDRSNARRARTLRQSLSHHEPRSVIAARHHPGSIEGRSSWVAASITLAILSFSYGAPLIVVVGLKPIAASLGTDRSVVALAASLVWLGTGLGGILMGRIADRIGMRQVAIFGALMTALGLAVSAIGQTWALVLGSAVLIGFLGNSAHFPPLRDLCQPLVRPPARHGGRLDLVRAIYRRRGLADGLRARHGRLRLAGDNAGVSPSWSQRRSCRWRCSCARRPPPVRDGRLGGAICAAEPRPSACDPIWFRHCSARRRSCAACRWRCPPGHLVALCSDLGIPRGAGAAMLSVLLGCAFVSRHVLGVAGRPDRRARARCSPARPARRWRSRHSR